MRPKNLVNYLFIFALILFIAVGCSSSGGDGDSGTGSTEITDSTDDASAIDETDANGDTDDSLTYALVDTGQISCYDDNGEQITCPSAGEAFYGQDAQLSGSQPSYTDNGDGTVTDNVTGLMWQQVPVNEGFNYDDAAAYCESLELAGYDDWRIPTTKELFSISNFSQGWPYLDTTYFSLAGESVSKDEQYWTERYVGTTEEGQDNAAFGVNHGTGHIKAYPAGVSGPMGNYVRAVRGTTSYGVNDFEDNGDGTVTDHATGLMWAKADSGGGMDWEAALVYAENFTLAGYGDWRLPNVKELQSIVDYTRSPSAPDAANLGPAIDTAYFEITELPAGTTNYETDYGYFWSSTSAYFGGDRPEYYYAWYVAFGTAVSNAGADSHGAGGVRFDTKVEGGPMGEGGERYYNYVRLVRGGNVTQSAGDEPDASDSTDTSGDSTDTSTDTSPDTSNDQTDEQPDAPAGGPDLAAAAAILGVTEAQLQEALGDPAEGQPDFAAAAAQLGVTEQELMDALAASATEADTGNDTDDAADSDDTNDSDSADSGALVINEIVAKDADGGNDWIELYVTKGTVALNNYTIVDDDLDHEVQELPDVFLSTGEFYIIEAIDEDDECPGGSFCVPFKLGSDDAVTLFKEGLQADIIDWAEGDADKGYSFGLLPDGSGTAQTLSPTKGAANEAIDDFDNTDTDDDTDAAVDFFTEDTVENVYITISETDWNSILGSPLLEEYHTASITYQGVTLENVAFRTKGSSSLQAVANTNSIRYSFKVDMNYYVDGQKLLGMKKINLNNNYKDPSYMRERIAYDMMRFLDIPTPRLAYVNLYINGSLHGLYTLVEQVDSEFLEENFENSEGDLYKPDGAGSDLLWIGDDFSAYSGVELKTNEDTSDNSAFINMVNELNNGSDLESVIDVDEVLRYLAVSTAISNLDSYQGTLAHNYYIYEQDGVFSIIPWDFNESFGTFRMECQDSSVITLYIDEPTSGTLADRPLIAKLLEYESYKTAYHGYIQDLMDGIMDPDVISTTIEETKYLIGAHVQNDPTAFYSYAEFEASLGDSMVGDVFGLQGFVEDRTENMAGQLSGTEPIEGDGSGSCSGGFMPGPRPGGGGMPR